MADPDNSFNTFLSEFTAHTGLDQKTNIDTYIQYYQARILDLMMRRQIEKMQMLIEKVQALNHI